LWLCPWLYDDVGLSGAAEFQTPGMAALEAYEPCDRVLSSGIGDTKVALE
jgi:hypothetical protein